MADNPVPVQTQVDELAQRVTVAEALFQSLLTVVEGLAEIVNESLGASVPAPPVDESLLPFPTGLGPGLAVTDGAMPCFHAQGMPPVIDALAQEARKAGPGGLPYRTDAALSGTAAGERLKERSE